MKKTKVTLLDLHYDVLKEILIRAARSSDGAKHFANAISVCKAFRSFVDDREILRAVSFDCLKIDGPLELFPRVGGLICKCAEAGQEEAQFILDELLITSSHYVSQKNSLDEMVADNRLREARDVCLEFSKALQECGVEKEELCGIEPELDVNIETTVLEKLDKCIKLLSDAEAIKERFGQHFLSVLQTFDFVSLKRGVEGDRAEYSDTREAERYLLSNVHTYFSR